MIKYFTIEDLLKHYLQKKFHILKKRESKNYLSFSGHKNTPISDFYTSLSYMGGIISVKAAALKSVNKEATSTPRQIQLPQGLSYIPYSFLCPT